MNDHKKRFLVFVYNHYYPQGGIGDVYGFYNFEEEAIIRAESAISNGYGEHWDIFDIGENRLMKSNSLAWEDLSL